MDLLLVLAIPIVLALAALRWGADSRERLRSDEERLASFGVAWEDTLRPTGVGWTSPAPLAADRAAHPVVRSRPRRRRLVSG